MVSVFEELINVKQFFCETCQAGWFGIKETSKSSGYILDFHENLGHKLNFQTIKLPKKMWGDKT